MATVKKTTKKGAPKKTTKAQKAHEDVAGAVRIAFEAPEPLGEGELAAVERKARRARKPPPATDPIAARAQLRRVVSQYEALVDESKRCQQRTGDYRDRETGEVINPCRLTPDQIASFQAVRKALDDAAEVMRREMLRLCRAFPIYNVFLKDVYGVGTVTAAKLLADVDIRRATKVSSLNQLCGLGVHVDEEGIGHAERLRAGTTPVFHNRLKTGLYQAWSSLIKAPRRDESPYFRRGMEHKHKLLSSPRFVLHEGKKDSAGNVAATFDGKPGGRAIVNNRCWRPAMQLFLEHLYLVWRALEGLPVWPAYEAAKLGYGHGGKVVVNAPKYITVDEALALVRGPAIASAAE